jgi:excisionase family DNA binding protein
MNGFPERLLLLHEVAAILRCSPRTVRRIIDDGDLVALKVRGSMRVSREALREYQRQQIRLFHHELFSPIED